MTAARGAALAEVVVTDYGHWPRPPHDRTTRPPGPGGHGLRLIEQLAGRADITTGPTGTTVALRWLLPAADPLCPPGHG